MPCVDYTPGWVLGVNHWKRVLFYFAVDEFKRILEQPIWLLVKGFIHEINY